LNYTRPEVYKINNQRVYDELSNGVFYKMQQ